MIENVSISLEKAVELCQSYRDKNGVRMFNQCWGCLRFSKGQPQKKCFYKPPNNDGCGKVNGMLKETK